MSTHWSLKCSIFAASVFSLSWCFAGWRQVAQTGALSDWGWLAAAAGLTLFLVSVQAYWIYFEEKARGRLTRRVGAFEKIDQVISGCKAKNKREGG